MRRRRISSGYRGGSDRKEQCSNSRRKTRERSGARRARARWHDVTVDEAKKRTPRWRLERSKWPRKRKRRRGKERGGEWKGGKERGGGAKTSRRRRGVAFRLVVSPRGISSQVRSRAGAEWSRGESWWPRVLKEIARRPSRLSAERGSGIQSTRSVAAHSGR